MTVRATVDGKVIAESDRTVLIEGNEYFPRDAVSKGALRETEKRTHCHWKGEAAYYDVVSGDEVLRDAAWSYPRPKQKAKRIKGHVAFTRKVRVASADSEDAPSLLRRLRAALALR